MSYNISSFLIIILPNIGKLCAMQLCMNTHDIREGTGKKIEAKHWNCSAYSSSTEAKLFEEAFYFVHVALYQKLSR